MQSNFFLFKCKAIFFLFKCKAILMQSNFSYLNAKQFSYLNAKQFFPYLNAKQFFPYLNAQAIFSALQLLHSKREWAYFQEVTHRVTHIPHIRYLFHHFHTCALMHSNTNSAEHKYYSHKSVFMNCSRCLVWSLGGLANRCMYVVYHQERIRTGG